MNIVLPVADELNNWLHQLYGTANDGWLSFMAINRATGERLVEWCPVADLDAAAEITQRLGQLGDVWNGVAIRTHRTSGRGGAAECGWLPGLWADIDYQDAGHVGNDKLPPDEAAAVELVRSFPVPPTAVVRSGGGLQAWWLFDEIVAVDDVGDLLDAFGATWAKVAEEAGYHVDNVFDLARIMRAPGTWNRKLEHARPVSLAFADWTRRYGVSEIRDHCIDPPTPTIERQRSDVPYIGPDRPGDEYNDRGDVHALITRHGFHTPRNEPDGSVSYRAPHRGPKDGTGATVYPDGHVAIWSETFTASHPNVRPHWGYRPFNLYAALEHGGDFGAAASALREQGFGAPHEPYPFGDRPEAPTEPPPNIDPETGEIVDDGPEANDTPAEDGKPEKRLLTIRWVTDAVEAPPPEPDAIVTNLIRRGEITVMGAPRAIGKTWASLNLAHMAAKGEGLLFGSQHFEITAPFTVMYLQGELGPWGSAKRWQMVSGGKPAAIAEVFDRCRIKVVTRRVTANYEGTTVADQHIDVSVDDRIEATIEEIGADLVVLDPWATYYSGNENSNDEVEAAVGAITDIARRTDTAWFIVHHISAKTQHSNLAEPEDLWRGASRLADAVSTRLTMLPYYTAKKAEEAGLDRVTARNFVTLHTLERNGPSVPTQWAERDLCWWRTWTPPAIGRPPALSDQTILDALRDGPVSSKTELAKLCGVSRPAINPHVDRLVNNGEIVLEPGPNRTQVIRLPEAVDNS